MAEDISSKVKKIVADHLGIDEAKVTDEASFIDDLGADSLDTSLGKTSGGWACVSVRVYLRLGGR